MQKSWRSFWYPFYILTKKEKKFMNSDLIKKMVLAAMFLAMGILLPYLTLNNPQLGQVMLLMHIPVLLCGVLVGPRYAFIVGALLPITRSLLIGMPMMFPMAVSMAFELATYGLVIGLLYNKLPKSIPLLYASLIGAMVAGRLVWATAMVVISGVSDVNFSFTAFVGGGFLTALPGIVLQLIVVPVIIIAFKAELSWRRANA